MKAWVAVCVLAMVSAALGDDEDKEYTNMWIAEIHGGEEVARRVARDLGYVYDGQAEVYDNHYVLTRDDHPEISKRNSHHLTRSLTDIYEVKWAEQQSILRRTKRGFIPPPPAELRQEAEVRHVAEEQHEAEVQQEAKKNDIWSFLSNLGSSSSSSSSSNDDAGSKATYYYPSGGGSSNYPFIVSTPAHHSSGYYTVQPGTGGGTGYAGKPTTYYYGYPSSYGAQNQQGDVSKLGTFGTKPSSTSLSRYKGVTKHVGCMSSKRSAYQDMFNDPLWPKEWYAHDYRTEDMPVMDHNVVPVWKDGFTGKKVTIAVVDDGVEPHPDLEANYVLSLSYDFNQGKVGSRPDPSTGQPNSHGTKCAGEIAMVANNNICGVGFAHNAKIAGIKTLGRRVVDYVEGRGLIHKLESFDIYSNSWGPPDDAKTMEKVGRLSSLSFLKGVTEGRKGKGVLYVFAGGNGKHDDDNCAADGLINHIHTIAISSVSQKGKTAYYSERCSAIYAGAYSGGNGYDEKVASIDLNGGCTTTFSGTSAATPLASGIFALLLDSKPDLTYRDVMHLITMGSEVAPVADNGDIWKKNGKGFWVSNDFGFGLLNAENMVNLAKTWKNVPKKNVCIVSIKLDSPQYLTVGEMADIEFDTVACQDTKNDAVYYLEQIELASTIQYPYRGALSIAITSPAGTKTILLEPRPPDSNRDGLKDWSIKSVHNWGEDPKGTWEIEVKANPLSGVRAASGYVHEFTLTFHGTAEKPAHHAQLPRKYSGFRLSNGQGSEVKN